MLDLLFPFYFIIAAYIIHNIVSSFLTKSTQSLLISRRLRDENSTAFLLSSMTISKYVYALLLSRVAEYFCTFIVLGRPGGFPHVFIQQTVHVWVQRDAPTTAVCVASFVVELGCCSLSRETTVCHSHRNRSVFTSP